MEILVHATAPSRGHDDSRYRALARAYLAFEPATRMKMETITTGREVIEDDEEGPNSQLHEELLQSTQEEPDSAASWRPDSDGDNEGRSDYESPAPPASFSHLSQDLSQYLASPQMSFNSVLDNADSPAFRQNIIGVTTADGLNAEGPQHQGSTASWARPPSTVADSQPEDIKPLLNLSSPTRMLELYLQQIDSSDEQTQESTGQRHHERHPVEIYETQRLRNTNANQPSSPTDVTESVLVVSDGPVTSSAFEARLPQLPVNSSNSELPQSSNDLGNTAPPDSISPILGETFPSSNNLSTQKSRFPSLGLSAKVPITTSSSAPELTLPLLKVNTVNTETVFSSSDITIPTTSTSFPSRSSPLERKEAERQSKMASGINGLQISATQNLNANLKSPWPETSSKINQVSSPSLANVPDHPRPTSQDSARPQKIPRIEPSSSQQHPSLYAIPSSRMTEAVTSPPPTQMPSSWAQQTEIRPPPPPTSSGMLTADILVTDSLTLLVKKMPPVKLYLPVSQTRDLRPMERGYWLVNTEIWNEELKQSSWNVLGNYVGKGMAGWGVWCVRAEDFSWIRVYCWGCVVEHIYVLLFMASLNKIKRTTAHWHGGDGEPVIKMSE